MRLYEVKGGLCKLPVRVRFCMRLLCHLAADAGSPLQDYVTVTYFLKTSNKYLVFWSVPYILFFKAPDLSNAINAPYHSRSLQVKPGHCDLLPQINMNHIFSFSGQSHISLFISPRSSSVHAPCHSRSLSTTLCHGDLLS